MNYAEPPRIYVGTYRRYNEGSLHGAWIDLEECGDAEEFWRRVNALHAAEIAGTGEIEPMFQCWENIPDKFISESHLNGDVWDQWVELDPEQRTIYGLYLDHVDTSGDWERAEESFRGTFDSELDFAYDHWDQTGMLDSIPVEYRNYIDYEAWLRDAKIEWVTFCRHSDGHVYAFDNTV